VAPHRAGVFFQFQKLEIPKEGGTVTPVVGLLDGANDGTHDLSVTDCPS